MRFEITYRMRTLNNCWVTKTLDAEGMERAEMLCQKIEDLDGYELLDITRIDHLEEVET